MILSVLIPTVIERKDKFEKLYERINNLKPKGVEIIFDDSPRYDLEGGISVGEKRQRLIDKSKGKYLVFVDDDDDITDDFFIEVLPNCKRVDVITYMVRAFVDGKEHIIDQSIKYKSEQLHEGITKRFPSVMNVFKTSVAKRSKFTNINCGEDFKWTEALGLKTQKHINKILQIYNYNSKDTIASTAVRRAIVTFANSEKYERQIEKMRQSVLKFAPGIDFFVYRNYEMVGCKPHSEYPYAFKPYAIHRTREQGYNQILWLDSPVHLTQSLDKLWEKLNEDKIILFDNIGWSIGSYTHDICLNHFNMTRKEANEAPMVMACAMAFDFRDDNIRNVFDTYLGYAHTDAYQGSWNEHRHDQSVISCIAYKRQIKLLHPNNTFIAYHGNEGHLPHAETVCLISQTI